MKHLALALFATILGLAALSAKTLDAPDQGLHLDVPDSWSADSTSSNAALSAVNTQNTSKLMLFAQPNPHVYGLDQPEFIAGVKNNFSKGLTDKGMTPTFTKEGPLTINGVPFYQYEGTISLPDGHTTYFQMYVAASTDHLYTLSFQSTDPTSTAELEGIANSFAFATPPQIPDPNRPKTRRQKIIRLAEIPAAIVGGLLIIGLVVFFAVRAHRNSIYEN